MIRRSPSLESQLLSSETKDHLNRSFSVDSVNQTIKEDNIIDDDDEQSKKNMSSAARTFAAMKGYMNSTRLVVLLVLCLQNSLFTSLRRYSQGVLKEEYSKHELLMVAELVKLVYSAWMIQNTVVSPSSFEDDGDGEGRQRVPSSTLSEQLVYLAKTSKKMMVLALIYGAMNILSFVSLRNISAGMFTIFSQTKILTTATFSSIMLRRQYSWTKWRALIALMFGVLLSSEPIWNAKDSSLLSGDGNPVLGITAVIIEVSLSGFASIYFEKVIKTDPQKLSIWERNFQLALGSLPVYMLFIIGEGGGTVGFFGGWSPMAVLLSILGAAGGLLVALSIKYGDSILKTLATTGAIVLTGILDYMFLKGPMTPPMAIAGVQVILAICNYTFDATPSGSDTLSPPTKPDHNNTIVVAESAPRELVRVNSRTNLTESSLRRV